MSTETPNDMVHQMTSDDTSDPENRGVSTDSCLQYTTNKAIGEGFSAASKIMLQVTSTGDLRDLLLYLASHNHRFGYRLLGSVRELPLAQARSPSGPLRLEGIRSHILATMKEFNILPLSRQA